MFKAKMSQVGTQGRLYSKFSPCLKLLLHVAKFQVVGLELTVRTVILVQKFMRALTWGCKGGAGSYSVSFCFVNTTASRRTFQAVKIL